MAWIAIAVGGALGSVAGQAALNVIVQVAGGLLAVWVGYQLGARAA